MGTYGISDKVPSSVFHPCAKLAFRLIVCQIGYAVALMLVTYLLCISIGLETLPGQACRAVPFFRKYRIDILLKGCLNSITARADQFVDMIIHETQAQDLYLPSDGHHAEDREIDQAIPDGVENQITVRSTLVDVGPCRSRKRDNHITQYFSLS